MDFKYKHKYEAEDGQNGMRKKCYGKKGSDLIIKVPLGTMVFDKETGHLMHDLKVANDSFVAAKGGRGGKGNVHFKNSVRQAPNFAEAGTPGKEREVILEVHQGAVGLVGFPNVGKSSLLAMSTNAKPKIENYHFTTIEPNLGVVKFYDTEFILADIAGIIEGAHQGLGLGLKFLKHIERTKVLIHVVDVSGSEGRDPIEDFDKIMAELESYSTKIKDKPMLVAANKIDLIDEDDEGYLRFKAEIEGRGYKVFPISAPINYGVDDLMNAALEALSHIPDDEDSMEEYDYFDFQADEELDENYRKVYASVDEEGVYVLSGEQLDKIFNSTNFNDMGSLRYLYKYVENSGAIKELKEMGLQDGDTIKINDFEFDYFDE